MTHLTLPHLSGVPHLHVNRPFRTDRWSQGVEERVPRGEEGFNPRFKILSVSGILNPLKCSETYKVLNVTFDDIDEGQIKFKGPLYFRLQYSPAKPIKWGINFLVVCESDSGYGHKFER